MDTHKLTVKEFYSTVATPRGMTPDAVDRQLRSCLAENKDFSVYVGIPGDLYIVPIESIREFYAPKIEPPKHEAPIDKAAFSKMMDFDPAAPVKLAEEPTAAPPKGTKKDVK